jgi:hypothetical protein
MDICNLRLPGALASQVDKSKIEECLPLDVQYVCLYWISHLQQSDIELCHSGQVHEFLKKHFLHWLEALSLIGKMSEGIHIVTDLSKHISTLLVSDTTLLYYL